MIYSYLRVSTHEQNTDRQLELLSNSGYNIDDTFIDKITGKGSNRPSLNKLLDSVKSNDTVIVSSLDRLARTVDDLKIIISQITEKGAKVQSLKEGLTFSNEENSMSKLMLHILGGIAEFERALIRERQAQGIAAARNRGIYKLTNEDIEAIKIEASNGCKKVSLASKYNVSVQTIFNVIKKGK